MMKLPPSMNALTLAWVLLLTACAGSTERERPPVGSFALTTEWYGYARQLGLAVGNESLPSVRLIDRSGASADVDSNHWQFTVFGQGVYRIVNESLGEAISLGVSYREAPGRAELAPTSRVSSQLWYVTPLSNGYCRLSTLLFGAEQPLDIVNDGENRLPKLSAVDTVSGQHWRLIPRDPLPADDRLSACTGVPIGQ